MKHKIFFCLFSILLISGCGPSNPFVQKDSTLYQRGVELSNADRDMDAVESFKKVLQVNPHHPLAHYNLGVLYDERGMFEEAIVEFREALRINPKNLDARYRLGVALATQGSDEEAIAQLQQVLKAEPSHVSSHYNLAVLYGGLGQADSAIEEYRKVIAIRPDHAEALNNLGLAYAKKGMKDAAQQCLEKAIAVRPGYFEALNNLGVVFISKNDYGRAADAFAKALRQNPHAAQTLYNLARINHENLHDYRAAVEYAQQYLALPGRVEKKQDMQDILAGARAALERLQSEAAGSVEARIRRDAEEFILAVQKSDFRDFYIFQPAELRETLTRAQWDKDLAGLSAAKLSEQRAALEKMIGFEDLLGVKIEKVEMLSPQKARISIASTLDSAAQRKELTWEEVNGKWAPAPFLQRITDNWSRAKVDATPHVLGD